MKYNRFLLFRIEFIMLKNEKILFYFKKLKGFATTK